MTPAPRDAALPSDTGAVSPGAATPVPAKAGFSLEGLAAAKQTPKADLSKLSAAKVEAAAAPKGPETAAADEVSAKTPAPERGKAEVKPSPLESLSPPREAPATAKPLEHAAAAASAKATISEPAPSTPSSAPPRRRGGFFAALLGGVMAAALGFGLAHYVPEGWPFGPGADRIATLERQLAAQETRLEALATPGPSAVEDGLIERLQALEARTEAPAAAEITALKSELAALQQSLAGADGSAVPDLVPLRQEMAAQITALRAEIAALPQSDPAELEALKAATQAEREAVEARAEALRAEAEATAKTALTRGAVLRVQAALETGAGFEAALGDLTSVGIALPASLLSHAKGIAPLGELQARFPEAARQALAATNRPDETAGMGARFTAFLTTQTGLRSLTPQEGSAPDAVLSRAEAAVQAGDLSKALRELDALPPTGAAALADWRAAAEARLAAATAAQSLIADLDKP